MAARRLVDLAAIASASASIGRSHLLLRSAQLSHYAATSSILNTRHAVTPTTTTTPTATRADAAKHLQHDSEAATIPTRTADPPGIPETHADVVGQADIDAEGLTAGGGELFYLRHGSTSEVLSNLPRAKIPRLVEMGRPGGLVDGINSEEFVREEGVKEEEEEEKEEEEELEKLGEQVFQSSRARGLFGAGRITRPPVVKTTSAAPEKTTLVEKTAPTPAPEAEITQAVVAEAEQALAQELGVDKKEIEKLAASIFGDVKKTLDVQQLEKKKEFQMTASRVPASRVGRLFHYGGLAAGLAWGAASESVRRVAGGAGDSASSVMFSEANVERLVKKLSRMRGAALKLGQMMSFQDNLLPAPFREVLARVQDSADYMPASQRDSVLAANLGANWRELFSEFTEVPMAAASIGQVHAAKLASSGAAVAVKVQYPGVASSISSDLNNLAVLLTASRLLPKGLYLDKTIANARLELGWECDYVREAACAVRFAKILEVESDVFRVPKIFEEACGPQVLTMEMMNGVAVTKTIDTLTQEERDFIGTQILGLCFREVAKYRFMQTDPNWTNFLWNAKDKKIELLDFGASREFPTAFIETYTSVLLAAANHDLAAIRTLSIKLGYLTGLESEAMTKAHVTSILTLAEPFSVNAPAVYDFSEQTVTERVTAQIPLMIRERLAPPPEETYSLHRKLSGAFLLCARLGSRVECRRIFVEALGGEEGI